MVDGRSAIECLGAKEAVSEAGKVLQLSALSIINGPPPVSLSIPGFPPKALQIKQIGPSESLVPFARCVLQWPLLVWMPSTSTSPDLGQVCVAISGLQYPTAMFPFLVNGL